MPVATELPETDTVYQFTAPALAPADKVVVPLPHTVPEVVDVIVGTAPTVIVKIFEVAVVVVTQPALIVTEQLIRLPFAKVLFV